MAYIERSLSGRWGEKRTLDRLLNSGKAEFLAIYGRRRIGKTFLVRRFFQAQPARYFEMVGRFEGTQQEQLRIFGESMVSTFNPGAVNWTGLDGWHEAFQALRGAIESSHAPKGKRRRSGRHSKTVLFFDELPWIATHRSGFLRELEHFWNAWCSKRDDILLIVCGSAASWMIDKFVNARGGLHNRLTQIIRLMPFSLKETEDYFHDRKLNLTRNQLAELYMMFGGVPHYLDRVERGCSVPQLVDRLCFDKDGPLNGELPRILSSLFQSDTRYLAVLRALAKKQRGLSRNELVKAVDIPSGGAMTAIMRNLEEAGFVMSVTPFGRTSRDRFFLLTDELTGFHMKWLDKRRPKSWQLVRGTPRWRAWAGLAFEGLCMKHARAIEHALGISGVNTEVSGWRHPEAQIDLVIDRADDIVSLCEVKYSDTPYTITKKYAAELRNKMAVFRRYTGTRKGLQLIFVTSRGLVANAHASELVDHTVTMADLFV